MTLKLLLCVIAVCGGVSFTVTDVKASSYNLFHCQDANVSFGSKYLIIAEVSTNHSATIIVHTRRDWGGGVASGGHGVWSAVGSRAVAAGKVQKHAAEKIEN